MTARDGSDWDFAPAARSASASPAGGWLAFVSDAPLTGFDNVGPCLVVSGTDDFTDGPCPEVYVYQAATGKLSCPSCNPTGVRPLGFSHLLVFPRATGAATPSPRYLTDSGRLFFDSQDSLSPFDTNGRVEDVYEFEPDTVGGCASGGGCVRLVSAGRSGVDSNFFATDPSGKNAFFTSQDRLLEGDKDDLIDLYDAREGGGFPAPAQDGSNARAKPACPRSRRRTIRRPLPPDSTGPGTCGRAVRSTAPRGRHTVRKKGRKRCVKRPASTTSRKRQATVEVRSDPAAD